jgi:hypothetical protein
LAAAHLGVLGCLGIHKDAELRFEEAPPDRLLSLDLS